MAREVGVFNDCPGLPTTLPDINVLDARELCPSEVLGCPHHPLYRHVIEGSTFAIPGSDAASQNTLNGTAV